MSEPEGDSRHLPLRREPLATLAVGAAVLVAIPIVVVFDPVAAIVRAIPWPGLPVTDVPDVPGWLRWPWHGLMVVALVLALAGALEKAAKSDRDRPDDER
jgi:hypothetical protein